MVSMILDLTIVALLGGCLIYGFLVSRKLKKFSAVLAGLDPMITEFSQAVDKSETSARMVKESLIESAKQSAAPAKSEPVPEPAKKVELGLFSSTHRSQKSEVNKRRDLIKGFFEASRVEAQT